VERRSYEFNLPLIDTSKKFTPLVTANNKSVIVETVKRAENGEGIVVRLYNSLNASVGTELSVGKEFKSAFLADMLERNPEPLSLRGKLSLNFMPFEI
jgi:alpha-mannosidase